MESPYVFSSSATRSRERKLRGSWTRSRACANASPGSPSRSRYASFFSLLPLLARSRGCSLQLQKFVARKARKFSEQNGRLALAALEFGYLFMCITHAPRPVILERMLPQTDALLAELAGFKETPSAYNGKFWDDWCLAMFLRGVCLRYVAYPVRRVWPGCIRKTTDYSCRLCRTQTRW